MERGILVGVWGLSVAFPTILFASYQENPLLNNLSRNQFFHFPSVPSFSPQPSMLLTSMYLSTTFLNFCGFLA